MGAKVGQSIGWQGPPRKSGVAWANEFWVSRGRCRQGWPRPRSLSQESQRTGQTYQAIGPFRSAAALFLLGRCNKLKSCYPPCGRRSSQVIAPGLG
jgi:hypothetical protein